MSGTLAGYLGAFVLGFMCGVTVTLLFALREIERHEKMLRKSYGPR